MTGRMPIISTNKKPYQVIPRTFGTSPYLEPPINLTKYNNKGAHKNGKSKTASTPTFSNNSGFASSNNPYRLKHNVEFGRQEVRNAELQRQSRERRSNSDDRQHTDNKNSITIEGTKEVINIKQHRHDDGKSNNSDNARMILLPCEVDSLIEEFGIADDATTVSKRFGTVDVIPDDGSVGSDCLLDPFCDDPSDHKEGEKKLRQEEKRLCNETENAVAPNDTSLITLPELSSIKSGKSSKSSGSASHRGKQQFQSENEPLHSDVSVLVLPKIQQTFGVMSNGDDSEMSKANLVTNNKQHSIILGSGKDNNGSLYRDGSFEAEEEEEGLDSFEAEDEEGDAMEIPKFQYGGAHTDEYCSDKDDAEEEEERMFQETQRTKSHVKLYHVETTG